MANETLIRIGILGETDTFEVEDETARANAANALARAQEALGMFPVSIQNGGTGADTKNDARNALDIVYDAQVIMGTYQGRDLTVLFADEIANYTDEAEWFNARVTANDWTGIRRKDYFDITLTDGKVFRYRIMAINPYLNAGDTEITVPHAIMVPDQVWPYSGQWNTTNTNQGTSSEKHPYLASNLHRWEINTFYLLIPAKWKNVIATHRALLEERYSANYTLTTSTGWSWADLGKVWSLSETEVYGEVVWGTQGYSKGFDCHFPGFDSTQARIRRNHSDERSAWWLRGADGSSSSDACVVGDHGLATGDAASVAGVCALPCFRVGV